MAEKGHGDIPRELVKCFKKIAQTADLLVRNRHEITPTTYSIRGEGWGDTVLKLFRAGSLAIEGLILIKKPINYREQFIGRFLAFLADPAANFLNQEHIG
ncbi:MAG: hypothetical protein WCP96_06895 [Methylococcaceae bacterium]